MADGEDNSRNTACSRMAASEGSVEAILCDHKFVENLFTCATFDAPLSLLCREGTIGRVNLSNVT